MIDPVAHDLVSQARMHMLLKDFFFGRLALYLDLKEDPSQRTLATDGKAIYYSPTFMRSIPPAQRTAELVHEIGHCVLDHISRRGAREPRRWNIACDYVVNLMVKDAGYQIGSDWLYDEKYRGMTAERVYDLLPENISDLKPQCCILDAPSSEAAQQAQTAQWKIAVQAVAIQAVRHNATLPASIQRLIDQIRNPPISWQDVLRRWMCEMTNDDYSWSRPNRKFAPHGLYLPSLRSEGMGTLGVVVDTSGSITGAIFGSFIGAIQDIANQARPERIVYMAADAEVHETEIFERGQLDVQLLRATGGGGTDFRPALTAMEEHAPAAVIYLTDLYGRYDEPPSYPVLWACTTDEVARWGETLHIEV
jgi:predicted metal-dependent peptidase